MTREEAIHHLENMKWLKGFSNTTVDGVPLDSVIDGIVALLKAQEPCEDAVSREAVINITAETGAFETQTRIKQLPSVQPVPAPRVMTAQEVINHIGPIYFEVDEDEELNGWVLFRGAVSVCSTKVKMVMQSRNQYCMMDDYGKRWRCWTTRPNRKQRQAVKWE